MVRIKYSQDVIPQNYTYRHHSSTVRSIRFSNTFRTALIILEEKKSRSVKFTLFSLKDSVSIVLLPLGSGWMGGSKFALLELFFFLSKLCSSGTSFHCSTFEVLEAVSRLYLWQKYIPTDYLVCQSHVGIQSPNILDIVWIRLYSNLKISFLIWK